MEINKKIVVVLRAVLTLFLSIFSFQIIQAGTDNPLKVITLDHQSLKTDDGVTTRITFCIPD